MAVIWVTNDATWSGAGWVLRYISETLRESGSLPKLSESFVAVEAGVPYIDFRELDKNERDILGIAVKSMVENLKKAGPSSLANPAFFPGLLNKLEELDQLTNKSGSE